MNYYKILGLKGPSASDDEIKMAYRKLSKKYHPDLHPGDIEIAELFKNINEAKDTLSDPKLKRRYNIRYFFHMFDNGVPLDLEKIKNSEFVKIFIGEEEIIGKEGPKADNSTSKSNLDEKVILELSIEEAFLGATKQISYKPYGEPTKKISVRVPRGSNNDTIITLKGEGRTANFGGSNGDLHIYVELRPDENYKLDKIDLVKSIEITPAEAAIGCEKSIQSIDMAYKLKIPAGTQPGEVIRVREAGFISKDGRRGDLQAVVKIGVPKELTKEEKELYAKLKDLHS